MISEYFHFQIMNLEFEFNTICDIDITCQKCEDRLSGHPKVYLSDYDKFQCTQCFKEFMKENTVGEKKFDFWIVSNFELILLPTGWSSRDEA